MLHFQKQNLGMAALAGTSRGIAGLRPLERRALTTAGLAGIPALVARPSVLQLSVDPGLAWLRPAALAVPYLVPQRLKAQPSVDDRSATDI